MKIIIVGVVVELQVHLEEEDATLLKDNFAAFEPAARMAGAQISISVEPQGDQYRVTWAEAENDGLVTSSREELVYNVEGFVVLGVQLARPDLLFLHGAVLSFQGRGIVLTGASGNGKSTLCWALTHNGCEYLSDELAPLSLSVDQGVCAQAYSHSLNLKRSPPGRYALPPDTPYTGWTHHVPARQLKGGCRQEPCDIHGIFLVKYDESGPSVEKISTADAVFRVYPNVLNGLAHPASGLSVVKEICQRVPVYDLTSNNLDESCKLLLETLSS